jgi:hypothetical protein
MLYNMASITDPMPGDGTVTVEKNGTSLMIVDSNNLIGQFESNGIVDPDITIKDLDGNTLVDIILGNAENDIPLQYGTLDIATAYNDMAQETKIFYTYTPDPLTLPMMNTADGFEVCVRGEGMQVQSHYIVEYTVLCPTTVIDNTTTETTTTQSTTSTTEIDLTTIAETTQPPTTTIQSGEDILICLRYWRIVLDGFC